MKKVPMFQNEVTGKLFDSKNKAISSEKKSKGIKELFSWVPDFEGLTRKKTDGSCDFTNGYWCAQWSEAEYERLVTSIIQAVLLYEPWITEQYVKHGGLKAEYVRGATMLGRYLCDNGSEISSWYELQMRICRRCYRVYGQPYYANNCAYEGIPGSGKPIETRNIK